MTGRYSHTNEVHMGKWLEAYRSGRWRDDLGTTRHSMEPGHWMEWQSLKFGSCVGQIVMTSSGGWVLVAGDRTPRGLAWVRQEVIHG